MLGLLWPLASIAARMQQLLCLGSAQLRLAALSFVADLSVLASWSRDTLIGEPVHARGAVTAVGVTLKEVATEVLSTAELLVLGCWP